jgi:hypothetical protein
MTQPVAADDRPFFILQQAFPPPPLLRRGFETGLVEGIAALVKTLVVEVGCYPFTRFYKWKWGDKAAEDQKQLAVEDHKLLHEIFKKNCGGILQDDSLMEKTRAALQRSKADQMYPVFADQFIACMRNKE